MALLPSIGPSPGIAVRPDLLKVSVPPAGPASTARIMVVGEAPGIYEMRDGIPFVGPVGNLLMRAFGTYRVARSDLYLVNVCDTQLPKNDVGYLYNDKGWHCPEWPALCARLHERIMNCGARVIMLAGQTALEAIFPGTKIGDWRGTPLTHPDYPGKYLLPMYHPAACLPGRMPEHYYTILFDLAKGLRLCHSDPYQPPIKALIEPTYDDTIYLLQQIRDNCEETAIDIELVADHISCIGFSLGRWDHVLTVPFFDSSGRYFSPRAETEVWTHISQIMGSRRLAKIGQNGSFDLSALWLFLGIKTNNYALDTMLLQHIAWTDLPKSLAYQVSVYTDYPYYKDENKTWRSVDGNDFRKHWLYNSKDVAYTHFIAPKVLEEVEQLKGIETAQHAMELHKPLLEMVTRGTLVDNDLRLSLRADLDGKAGELLKQIQAIAGEPLNPRSPDQLKAYFYKKHGIAPYKDRKTGKITTGSKALKGIRNKGGVPGTVAGLILKYKKFHREVSNYFDAEISSDSRFRCEYKISGTETGRLASGKNIMGFGTNMQNLTHEYKRVLKADQNYLLGELDLSQAESRVVAWESDDANMKHCYLSKLDAHTFNAAHIYSIPYAKLYAAVLAHEEWAIDMRKMGKKIVHASNYSMGAATMAEFTELPLAETRALAAAYHERFPSLRKWHHKIRTILAAKRILYNLFGRPKRFLGVLDDDTFRSAYAYIPQSTVGACMTRGLTAFAQDRRYYRWGVQGLATVHDSFLFQIPILPYLNHEQFKSYVFTICQALAQTFTMTLTAFNGETFSIPCDFKLGFSWATMAEFKQITAPVISSVLDYTLSQNVPAHTVNWSPDREAPLIELA